MTPPATKQTSKPSTRTRQEVHVHVDYSSYSVTRIPFANATTWKIDEFERLRVYSDRGEIVAEFAKGQWLGVILADVTEGAA